MSDSSDCIEPNRVFEQPEKPSFTPNMQAERDAYKECAEKKSITILSLVNELEKVRAQRDGFKTEGLRLQSQAEESLDSLGAELHRVKRERDEARNILKRTVTIPTAYKAALNSFDRGIVADAERYLKALEGEA